MLACRPKSRSATIRHRESQAWARGPNHETSLKPGAVGIDDEVPSTAHPEKSRGQTGRTFDACQALDGCNAAERLAGLGEGKIAHDDRAYASDAPVLRDLPVTATCSPSVPHG